MRTVVVRVGCSFSNIVTMRVIAHIGYLCSTFVAVACTMKVNADRCYTSQICWKGRQVRNLVRAGGLKRMGLKPTIPLGGQEDSPLWVEVTDCIRCGGGVLGLPHGAGALSLATCWLWDNPNTTAVNAMSLAPRTTTPTMLLCPLFNFFSLLHPGDYRRQGQAVNAFQESAFSQRDRALGACVFGMRHAGVRAC